MAVALILLYATAGANIVMTVLMQRQRKQWLVAWEQRRHSAAALIDAYNIMLLECLPPCKSRDDIEAQVRAGYNVFRSEGSWISGGERSEVRVH